jgi:hypothetical protein
MLLSIPPKYAVSQVVGYMKGKSAIQIAWRFLEVKRDFAGQHFWARGYFVSTVGRDETVIRAHIRAQEAEDKQAEQLRLQQPAAFRWLPDAARERRPETAALSGSRGTKPQALPGDAYGASGGTAGGLPERARCASDCSMCWPSAPWIHFLPVRVPTFSLFPKDEDFFGLLP